MRYKGPNNIAAPSRPPLWLSAAFWVSVVIALAAVARRLVALARPSQGSSPMAGTDAGLESHALMTTAHIVPAAMFVTVAACPLLRRANSGWLQTLFFVL